MKEIWDERYRASEYIYGIEPNVFFIENLMKLKPGRLLLPADGEGRNGVAAALKGWEADAFDFSGEARKKAMILAELNRVEINYKISSLEEYIPAQKAYDAVALIFVHMPPILRKQVHLRMISALKSGACLILEAYEKSQINKGCGGPTNQELLFTTEMLKEDFRELKIMHLRHVSKEVNEGSLHKGMAEVVQFIGIKP